MRTVRRMIVTVLLVSMIIFSCRRISVKREITWEWLIVIGLFGVSRYLIDARYRKPYRQYGVGIVMIVWLVYVWLVGEVELPGMMILIYVMMASCVLRWWMLRPHKVGTILIMILAGWGGLMMVPWKTTSLSHMSIMERLPPLTIERNNQNQNESLMVIDDQGKRAIRSGVQHVAIGKKITIQYASSKPHINDAIITTNTLSIIALEPQSVATFLYENNQRSITIQGKARYYGGMAQHATMSQDKKLEQLHKKHKRKARNIANELRPSSRTQTRIGAWFVRIKLIMLEKIDEKYAQDRGYLNKYQCLVYGYWCETLPSVWKTKSLEKKTRDSQLGSLLGMRKEKITYFLP